MAPVVYALRSHASLETRVCVSGQHRELLQPALDLFSIDVDYDLQVMRDRQTLSGLTARVLETLEQVMADFRPEIVLVHGDTSTGFAASLSAFYHNIPVAHVEAGLRTGNLQSPWPEEFNRKSIAQVATLNFAPTKNCEKNLLAEGVAAASIVVTGNTVIDALIHTRAHLQSQPGELAEYQRRYQFLAGKKLILVTGHRRENYGEGLNNICGALKTLARMFHDKVEIVYPVHLNPNIREPVEARLSGISNLHLVEPKGYSEFVYLLDRAYVILTDSGGIQEEAPAFGKPVLVMRDTTERPEAIDAGTALLVGTDQLEIVRQTTELLEDADRYRKMATICSPFGDGSAAIRIAQVIAEFLPNNSAA